MSALVKIQAVAVMLSFISLYQLSLSSSAEFVAALPPSFVSQKVSVSSDGRLCDRMESFKFQQNMQARKKDFQNLKPQSQDRSPFSRSFSSRLYMSISKPPPSSAFSTFQDFPVPPGSSSSSSAGSSFPTPFSQKGVVNLNEKTNSNTWRYLLELIRKGKPYVTTCEEKHIRWSDDDEQYIDYLLMKIRHAEMTKLADLKEKEIEVNLGKEKNEKKMGTQEAIIMAESKEEEEREEEKEEGTESKISKESGANSNEGKSINANINNNSNNNRTSNKRTQILRDILNEENQGDNNNNTDKKYQDISEVTVETTATKQKEESPEDHQYAIIDHISKKFRSTPPSLRQTKRYVWSQTEKQITVKVPLPRVVNRRELQFMLTENTLSIGLNGKTKDFDMLAGKLAGSVDPTSSSWNICRNGKECWLDIYLTKYTEPYVSSRWYSLLGGETEAVTCKYLHTTENYMWKQSKSTFDIIIPVDDWVQSNNVHLEIGSNKDELKIFVQENKSKSNGKEKEKILINGKTVGALNPHDCLWFLDYDTISKSKCIFATIGKHSPDTEEIWSRLLASEKEDAYLFNLKFPPIQN